MLGGCSSVACVQGMLVRMFEGNRGFGSMDSTGEADIGVGNPIRPTNHAKKLGSFQNAASC